MINWIYWAYPLIIAFFLISALGSKTDGSQLWNIFMAVVNMALFAYFHKENQRHRIPRSLRNTLADTLWQEADGTVVQVLRVEKNTVHFKYIKIIGTPLPAHRQMSSALPWLYFNRHFQAVV